jgi:RNA polymerase sigma-70 factor (sigma-E family)
VTATEDDVASFVAARWPSLVRYGFMLSGDRAAGEDLVQEALLRCLPSWGRLDPPGVESYVRKVMARLARKAHRHPRRMSSSRDQAEPTTSDIADSSSEQSDLRRALKGLPAQQRVVLVLRYWQDLNEAEIAELLGCRQGTVKSRASRAYARLREQLDWSVDGALSHEAAAARGETR